MEKIVMYNNQNGELPCNFVNDLGILRYDETMMMPYVISNINNSYYNSEYRDWSLADMKKAIAETTNFYTNQNNVGKIKEIKENLSLSKYNKLVLGINNKQEDSITFCIGYNPSIRNISQCEPKNKISSNFNDLMIINNTIKDGIYNCIAYNKHDDTFMVLRKSADDFIAFQHDICVNDILIAVKDIGGVYIARLRYEKIHELVDIFLNRYTEA